MSFRKLRMRRLLDPRGRCLVVAMDHTPRVGSRGVRLDDPARVVREAEAGGADAVLLRPGMVALHSAAARRMAVIASLGHDDRTDGYGVEWALRMGADAVKIEAFPGSTEKAATLPRLRRLGADCDRWGLPLLGEMIPVGFDATEAHTVANVAAAARVGADLGSDLVKVPFAGDAETFREVVQVAQVPVVILGGSPLDDPTPLLIRVREALDAGAAGAAVGRSVWAHPHPGRMTAALARLIHDDCDVETALAELRPGGVR